MAGGTIDEVRGMLAKERDKATALVAEGLKQKVEFLYKAGGARGGHRHRGHDRHVSHAHGNEGPALRGPETPHIERGRHACLRREARRIFRSQGHHRHEHGGRYGGHEPAGEGRSPRTAPMPYRGWWRLAKRPGRLTGSPPLPLPSSASATRAPTTSGRCWKRSTRWSPSTPRALVTGAAVELVGPGGFFKAFIDLVPAGFSEYRFGGNRASGAEPPSTRAKTCPCLTFSPPAGST